MSGAASIPRVISIRREAAADDTPRAPSVCAVCGYDLGALVTELAWPLRCPECGAGVERSLVGRRVRRSLAPGEAASLRRGAGLAVPGLILIAVVPIVGACLDAAGWWHLVRPHSTRVRGVDRLLLGLAWVLSALTLALAVAAWVVVLGVYAVGIEFAGLLADDVAAGVFGSAAVVAWSARHAVCGALLLRRGVHRAAGTEGSLLISAVGAPVLSVSGVLLIGVGAFVLHIALFPPVCLLLPLWLGAGGVWLVLTLVALAQIRRVGVDAAPGGAARKLQV